MSVLRRAIGLYAKGTLWPGFTGCFKMIMLVIFQWDR